MVGMCRTLMAVLLCILLPATLLAANPGAMLYAKGGDVFLNGVLAPESSAIFTGDRVTTTPTSAVNLVLQGSSVVLEPQSTLLYQGAFFDLSAGGVSVATRNQMQGRSGDVTVTPAAPVETHYRMARVNGILLVAALTGSVKVVDHGTETLLAAGDAMSFAEDQPNQNNQRRRRPVPPAAGTTGEPVLLAATVIGAALLIVYLTTRAPCKKVSPEGSVFCQGQ